MKLLKVTLLIAVLCVAATFTSNAQNYAKIEYWGKTYPIDQTFFQIVNANYDQFIRSNAPTYRWYDYRDYSSIYVKMIDCFKDPAFSFVVTEANQVKLRNTSLIFPGTDMEPGRSKKSMTRAMWMINDAILPAVKKYVDNYNKVHQFQY